MTTSEAADREQIRDLLCRYARALDERDFEAVRACFAADARAEYSGVRLEPGADSIVRHLVRLESIPASTHLVGNALIELRGDEASVSSQALVHLLLGGGRLRVRGIRYRDRVVRADGGWVIAERVHRADWSLDVHGDEGA